MRQQKVRMAALFAQELSDHTGVPLDAIFYTATHAHATPEITDEITMDYLTFDENSEEVDISPEMGTSGARPAEACGR